MAKGMDTGTIALLAGGGYLAYAAYSGSWPFSPAVPTTLPTTPNYIPAKTPVTKPADAPATTPATPPAAPAPGATSIVNGATYQWNGSAWTLIKAAPQPQVCQTGYHRLNASDPTSDCIADVVIGSKSTGTFCDLNTPGWSIDANGVCVQTPAADTRTVSQKMVAAAGMSDGLSTDEWCYYYSQVTGNDCPVDPGSITYDSGDRSTPISIGEWLSIMNQTGAGLSGLGDDSTPNWGVLVAAGLAYFLLMGGAR